ncbi:mechanosensitive ion channel [candidate division KSB1 bacterium]|nr:mechanosensitive ion channel [candidate division KSB1 bacterium]
MNDMSTWTSKIIDVFIEKGPMLILALLTLIFGLWFIKILVHIIDKSMEHGKLDISLRKFLKSFVSLLLKVLLAITVASMIGIKMTSFIAVLGAAGLAVGLALQGSLSNLAGGVLILLFKPFHVGDVIEAQGFTGKVTAIQVFHTILNSFDNKRIIIPNANLSNGNIVNYSAEALRRVDMTFSVGYNDDLKKVREILENLVKTHDRILQEPAPMIVLSKLANSSIDFVVRVWCNSEDYWDIYHGMLENVKLEFDKNQISIPFPQQDIHIYKHE